MHPYVKMIRTASAGIDGVWVRRWKDGVMYAGVTWKSVGSADAAKARLDRLRVLCVELGFECGPDGKPGTSGEYSFILAETEALKVKSHRLIERKTDSGFRIRYRFGPDKPWRFFLDPRNGRKHARYATREAAEAASNRRPILPHEKREIV